MAQNLIGWQPGAVGYKDHRFDHQFNLYPITHRQLREVDHLCWRLHLTAMASVIFKHESALVGINSDHLGGNGFGGAGDAAGLAFGRGRCRGHFDIQRLAGGGLGLTGAGGEQGKQGGQGGEA